MSTKTNHEYTSNTNSGGIMANDSPAALLDMLAEVASQTLHSEKRRTKSVVASQYKPKTDLTKRKTQEVSFNVAQLLSMPASQLVKQFSIFTSDELKRQYSYTCALIIGCGQKYTSFASEGRARMSIKAHLAEHLEYLKSNKEAYNSFTARSVNYKSCKTNTQNKKHKLPQSKKPQETLNKENKNVIMEKSTNYLRNILLNDINFKDLEKHNTLEKSESPKKLHNSEQKDVECIDFKVLGDHSYFERMKDEVSNGREAVSINNTLDNTLPNENIVFMVVGTDSVHMKEYSHINQKLTENVNQEFSTVYLPEIDWTHEGSNKNAEIITTTKPKGKAKFIGTSKEEREMALAFMDHIKKKGNPVGNNLECCICNPPRSFTAPTTLVSHYRSHAGIKPYECRICRAVFTRRHSLKYHMLIHQNQTRFTCSDCGKKFRHPSHFREHRRRHTGEAPFGCDDCGQRFKTRNTYKRHLKTRHGKVLTTTGELLYLSEEEFQKVRTNRKRKPDVTQEPVMDEDTIASTTIMNYPQDNDVKQIVINTSEEYILNTDTEDSDAKWKNEHTVHFIPKSDLNKTDAIETEIHIVRISNENVKNTEEEYLEKVDNGLPQFQGASYDSLEVVQCDENPVVYEDDIDDQTELIYNVENETSSYVKTDYDQENNTAMEYEENINMSKNQMEDHIHIINHSSEVHSEDTQNNDVIETQSILIDSVEEVRSHSIDINTEDGLMEGAYDKQLDIQEQNMNYLQETECQEEIILSADSEELGEGEITLHTMDKLKTEDTLQSQRQVYVLQNGKELNNYQSAIADLMKDQTIASNNLSTKQGKLSLSNIKHLYVHTEPLTGIIVQNKCINILPRHFNSHNEQHNTLKAAINESSEVTALKKEPQRTNTKENGIQSAMFLLSSNTVKSDIPRTDQNTTATDGMNRQTLKGSK